jgi:thiol:disulfide interchange protein
VILSGANTVRAVWKWATVVALAAMVFGCGQKTAAPVKTAGDPPSKAGAPVATGKIAWLDSYEKAVALAKEQKRPLMVDVMADWCSICKRMDAEVYTRADVAASAAKFVPVKVDGDKRPELKQKLDVSGYPTLVLLTPDGKEVGRVRGGVPYQLLISALDDAAGKAK